MGNIESLLAELDAIRDLMSLYPNIKQGSYDFKRKEKEKDLFETSVTGFGPIIDLESKLRGCHNCVLSRRVKG
jgi:hypothetical protein